MKPQPLPKYPSIALSAIKPASALLFYGGNKLTQFFGNKIYKHPYTPPAFHAALYIENGLFLNVGAYKTIEDLSKQLASTQRVDVIEYFMPEHARKDIVRASYLDTTKPKGLVSLPDYGWKDYLRFGIKFLRPSRKDFCSENVVELIEGVGRCKVSARKAVDTAPWHLLEFAEANPGKAQIFTYHSGKDFRG